MEYDRNPHDRLEQIESAARALVEDLKRRGSYGHEAMLMMKLEALLDAKPGAVSWRSKP
jgi:hypothetical protein